MFKLLSFLHLYLLFYFLAFEFVNVEYTSFYVPVLAMIGQSLVVISQFMWFFKMTTEPSWFFKKIEILTVCPLLGANLRHHAKFDQNRSNRSNGCGDMAL